MVGMVLFVVVVVGFVGGGGGGFYGFNLFPVVGWVFFFVVMMVGFVGFVGGGGGRFCLFFFAMVKVGLRGRMRSVVVGVCLFVVVGFFFFNCGG